MIDVVIISWNENGFWQGDLYRDWTPEMPEGVSPDNFFTCLKDADYLEAVRRSIELWPTAFIYVITEEEQEDDE